MTRDIGLCGPAAAHTHELEAFSFVAHGTWRARSAGSVRGAVFTRSKRSRQKALYKAGPRSATHVHGFPTVSELVRGMTLTARHQCRVPRSVAMTCCERQSAASMRTCAKP